MKIDAHRIASLKTCGSGQGHFGHRVRKPTWLYAVGCDPVALPGARAENRVQPVRSRTGAVQLLSRKQRKATPLPFRDLLLNMARTAEAGRG